MIRNFTIERASALVGPDQSYFDLHNYFNLLAIKIYFHTKQLFLGFECSDIAASPINRPRLELRFDGVDYLDMSAGLLRNWIVNFDEIGFKQPDDFDLTWLAPEERSASTDHLILRLDGDEYIRIHSRTADLFASTAMVE